MLMPTVDDRQIGGALHRRPELNRPAEVNPEDYKTVVIWRRRINYTFNAAEIHAPPAELTGLGWINGG